MPRPVSVRSLILLLSVLSTPFAPHLLAAEPPATEPARGPTLEQVVVVFKTHFDIGYTGLASEVVERYRTSMIDKALDVCDASRALSPEHRFLWTIPGWPMAQILWPGQTPERRGRIERAIRDGRLVWHALPVTTHTESLDLEDFVRGMGFSSQLSRQFGMPLARDAKMTDVPSHTWIVPTVLRHAGVDFLHVGCNSASGSPDVPRLFWWEGPDGSRLLTMYEASGYGSGLKPPDDWPHETWLALIHTGDNQGPPPPDQVQKLLAQAERELPGVNVRMGRLSDFADAILAEKPDLPVIRADMPDTWIHGIMSMPQETSMARRTRPRIGALEAIETLLPAWGAGDALRGDGHGAPRPPVPELIADAYEGSLMFGEHTWGYSMSPFGYHYGDEWAILRQTGHYARLEKSWREHGAYIHKARELVAPALKEHVATLAQATSVDGPRIVVFNPLPWPRDRVAFAEVPAGNVSALLDATTGDAVPVEVAWADPPLGGDDNRVGLRFVAHNLPSFGYRTYVPARTPLSKQRASSSATIENAYLRIRLDASQGVIASIVDKRSGRELVNPSSEYGFGQYVYERFDTKDIDAYFHTYLKYIPGWAPHFARRKLPPADEAPHTAASPREFSLGVRESDDRITASMVGRADENVPQAVALDVTLNRGHPYVDLSLTVLDKKSDPWPEAGWVCLPFQIHKPTFRLGRLGSVVDPTKDARRGSNFDVFCLSTGMTITGPDGKGVGLCPLDSPLVSIGRPGLYQYAKEFGRREPVVFVNLFNNVWGTNFQQWTEGTSGSRIRIWAVEGKGIEADLITPSWEARSPCRAAYFDGPAGKLPPSQSGIELSRKGVLVTAFGPNPDGDGVLLRLWEQSGDDGPCRVRLPEGMDVSQAQPCDLRGRPRGEPIPVGDGALEVKLTHFAPASLILNSPSIPAQASLSRSRERVATKSPGEGG